MRKDEAKIISFVPSWTETLVECGVNVLGRTRFCIHPEPKVSQIPIVGGTKTYDFQKLIDLKPEFVVLDKEENKRELAVALERAGIQTIVSHVTSIENAIEFLRQISHTFKNSKLLEHADRYQNVLNKRSKLSTDEFWRQVVISNQNSAVNLPKKNEPLIYLIWKNPFMCVAEGTFIWQQFLLFNLNLSMPEGHKVDLNSPATKYPQVPDEQLKNFHNLLSSEPFPFEKALGEFDEKNLQYTLIDGEKLSWYGTRNLRFLEACLKA